MVTKLIVMWGQVYWPTFLIVTSILFLIPETIALLTNTANTLSDYCWRQLNVSMAYHAQGIHSVAWWLSIIAWGLFVFLITIHIWWRGV